jgi:hypothetical protein
MVLFPDLGFLQDIKTTKRKKRKTLMVIRFYGVLDIVRNSIKN